MTPEPNSCPVCACPLAGGAAAGVCPACERTLELVGNPVETVRPASTDGPAARVRAAGAAAPPPLPPNPPGLALVRLLGAGGMGAVYLAADAETRRFVAVKLLHAPGAPGAFDRFRAEVRALAALDHPHIVTVFASHLHHHPPYYTMEFVPGGTLARHVGASGPLAPRAAAAVVARVARAAHAAHACGIVHRDIKPGNVLLGGGAAPDPKLSDFGLAKRTDRDEGLTLDPGALGTPGFMAPEQAAGGPVTARTDVYGLGATLYHALTGAAPFEGPDVGELLSRVRAADPRPVRALRPDVPADLAAVVHTCLEKDPAARYASAAELAADLDRFAAGVPVSVRPPTPLGRARRAVLGRRRALARAALAAVALAAVFALGASVPRPPEAREAPEAAALRQMQTDLGAKKAVPLVGPTGAARWHEWAHEAGAFAPNPRGAEPCSFRALGRSLLDLCPDPMTDRYRVRAELRQIDVDGRDHDGRLPEGGESQLGFYVGRQRAPGNRGWRADVCLAVRFTETPANRAGRASFGRLLLAGSPSEPRYISDSAAYAAAFAPAATMPGPWHVVEAEVTPAGIKVWFDPAGPEPVPFAHMPAAEVTRWYTEPNTRFDAFAPNNGIALPVWSPRGALGVWADGTSVSVRNVTLSPLK